MDYFLAELGSIITIMLLNYKGFFAKKINYCPSNPEGFNI